jgi:hypothetical protein
MKDYQYILCNIPQYFNENDIKKIEDNYKHFIFPKKKLIIKIFKYNTFYDFILSLSNEMKELNFENKYSNNILLIDGRIHFTSKLKDIKQFPEKIYNIPLQTVAFNIKKTIYNHCNINDILPFYLYSFIYLNKKYITNLIETLVIHKRNIENYINYYDDKIFLTYLHKNKNIINEITINYTIKDYDFFTMSTFGRMGRLGNQIFQWIFLNGFCKKYNRILKLPYTLNKKNDKFSIHLHKLFNIKLNHLSSLDYYRPIYTYQEKKFNYNEILEKINFEKNNNYDFFGYYQAEKYFKHININRYLEIHNNLYEECKKKIVKYKEFNKDCSLISLHIRRGDLVQARQYGPSISKKYIQETINYMREKNKKIIWLIFSDDIDWCQTTLRMKEPIYYPNGNLLEDFIMMSLCDDNIISNSTYSWWASYLNKNKNKKIVCPKEWFYENFLPKGEDDSDLIPSDWIRF